MKNNRVVVLTLLFGGIFVAALTMFATPQPVLLIAPVGSSQLSITITNGDVLANYEIYRTPVLADVNYPWTLEIVGDVGQTNFTVDMGDDPIGFFQALVGSDADGDGIENYRDGDPNDPTVGALSITIDSPVNGGVFN